MENKENNIEIEGIDLKFENINHEVINENLEVSKEVKKRGRSRRSGKVSDKMNLDYLVTLFTIFSIGYILYNAVFVTLHTDIDINKNEKGEISLIIDYNENNIVETPGKDIWPMIEEVLNMVKNKING